MLFDTTVCEHPWNSNMFRLPQFQCLIWTRTPTSRFTAQNVHHSQLASHLSAAFFLCGWNWIYSSLSLHLGSLSPHSWQLASPHRKRTAFSHGEASAENGWLFYCHSENYRRVSRLNSHPLVSGAMPWETAWETVSATWTWNRRKLDGESLGESLHHFSISPAFHQRGASLRCQPFWLHFCLARGRFGWSLNSASKFGSHPVVYDGKNRSRYYAPLGANNMHNITALRFSLWPLVLSPFCFGEPPAVAGIVGPWQAVRRVFCGIAMAAASFSFRFALLASGCCGHPWESRWTRNRAEKKYIKCRSLGSIQFFYMFLLVFGNPRGETPHQPSVSIRIWHLEDSISSLFFFFLPSLGDDQIWSEASPHVEKHVAKTSMHPQHPIMDPKWSKIIF